MASLKILELFGGIGACSKALERLGIDYEIADYVEIDKYAVASFNAMHNTNFEPQDICGWDKDIDVDLIMHGSPCQDFSLAGKQAGGDENSGTRSSLMYETLRIVKKLKPKYVIWENVKNILSVKHRHNFDSYLEKMESLGYTNYYQVLNAKDYGIPQNRERVFTISILGNNEYVFPQGNNCNNKVISYNNKAKHQQDLIQDEEGLCRCIPAGTHGSTPHLLKTIVREYIFPPKQELKLKLKDILEKTVDEKYYLSEEQCKLIQIKLNNKSTLLIDNCQARREGKPREYNDVAPTISARDYKEPRCIQVGNLKGGKWDKINESCRKVYDEEGLSPTIHTCQGGNTEPKVLIKNNTKKGYLEAKDGDGINISSRMKYQRGNVQKQLLQTITTSGGNDRAVVTSDLRIRKITPKECWRLMGFDDEDFEKAEKVNSNTQLYKQAGNSIVVNVLEAILRNLLLNENTQRGEKQLTIFDLK